MRRLPAGMAGAYLPTLGDDGDGFDWGGFFTQIGTSAAKGAAQAGIQKLTQTIGGQKPATAAPLPIAPTAAGQLGSIPVWGWALGGLGLVLVLVLAMKR